MSDGVRGPYPSPTEYPVAELMGDLHHLLQPLIGFLRIEQQDGPTERGQYEIERLLLALGLANIAAGLEPWKDVDVRDLRSRHGCGLFEADREKGSSQ